MPIDQRDVSVLIPCFRRPEMTCRAVASALDSGAGEIVVSDNASGDGTIEALARFHDPRLRISVQPLNIGLWPNHLSLLRLATRPWIKFLHDDDRLTDGGLARMVAHAGAGIGVVSAINIYERGADGPRFVLRSANEPVEWSSEDYMRRFPVVGNEELSTPSNTLYPAEILDTAEAAWRDDRSADLIQNVVAASRGRVVLLPAGPIITVVHAQQDSQLQSLELWFERLRNTMRYLSGIPDPRIRRFVSIYGFAESISSVRIALASIYRGTGLYKGYGRDLLHGCARSINPTTIAGAITVLRRLRFKYGLKPQDVH